MWVWVSNPCLGECILATMGDSDDDGELAQLRAARAARTGGTIGLVSSRTWSTQIAASDSMKMR
jgi:hypothetical protein